MTVQLAPGPETLDRLAAVAAGREPAQIVVLGGDLLDVHANEIRREDIAIVDGRVAATGPDLSESVGPLTTTIDARGKTISPGLVEPHSHLVRMGLSETARLQVAAGITTTIMEVGDLAYICGPEAVRQLLKQLESLPARVLISIPPLIGIDELHESKVAPDDDWIDLLFEPGVVGVGEIYWADLLRAHRRARHLIARALELGLAVEGHGAGARGPALAAMVASGVGSDHEPISVRQVSARISLGLYVYLREGVTRQDFDLLAPALRLPTVALDRVAFCTDGVEPASLLAGNSLNALVEKAIDFGLPPTQAVRMASLVPAERFGLTPWVGSIVPGAFADLALLDSIATFRPTTVLCAGLPPTGSTTADYPGWMLDTVHIAPIPSRLLEHPGRGSWRAIEISAEAPLVTREIQTDGVNATVVAAIDRLGEHRAFTGLLVGFGLRHASVASSVGSDSRALLAVGDDPDDLSLAIATVERMQGGVSVVSNGRQLAAWRATLGGVLSEEPANVVANAVGKVNRVLTEHGCKMRDPLLTLDFLTSPAVPHLRISAAGYTRFHDGIQLGLAWG